MMVILQQRLKKSITRMVMTIVQCFLYEQMPTLVMIMQVISFAAPAMVKT